MTTETQVIHDLTERMLAAVIDDQRVPLPTLHTPEDAYLRVRAATGAMAWTMAAMPRHQLVSVGRYLRWVLDQEPIRSEPLYEPQRTVLALLLLALRDIVRSQPEGEVAQPVAMAVQRPAHDADEVSA